MADGYFRGKVDTGWWMENIHAGIEFRKRHAYEHKWRRWRQYYRGEWRKDVMPVNLFFTLLRTIVPRVYFRNPSVSVVSTMPGFESALFARMLQRTDAKLFRQMRIKREMKKIVGNTFRFGTGIGKLGYGAQYTPTPNFGGTGEPLSSKGERVEYRDNVFVNMPWFSAVPTGTFIVPDGTANYEDARWVATWFRRPVEDVKSDPRFKNTDDLSGSKATETLNHTTRAGFPQDSGIEEVDLIEVRDKKFNRVFVLAPFTSGNGIVLFDGEDEFLIDGAFPLYPIVFNEDDEVFWGTPDSQILEPYQLEINEIRTQSMKHRRLSIVKILVKRGVLSDTEAEKMLSESVGAVVTIDGDLIDVRDFQISNIPGDLILAGEIVQGDVKETVGFSRNQSGQFKEGKSSRVSATEASIVDKAVEIRVDERRDAVADMIVNLTEGMHTIIFNHWDQPTVVDVIGPGGVPLWVKFRGSMLRQGQYQIKAEPDSNAPETKELRQQKAMLIYEKLKSNPLIDPQKLTQYLINEIPGAQFDDMLRALPPPQNAPGGPVNPQEFGGLVADSLKQAGNDPSSLRKPNGAG